MKAINLNQKCAGCKHETDKCIKLSDMQSDNTICYDSNEIDIELENMLFDALQKENQTMRKSLKIFYWLFVICMVLSIIGLFFKS